MVIFVAELFDNGKTKQTKEFRSFLYRYPLLFFFPINICYSADKNQIFYCFTGLSYSDLYNLTKEEIKTGIDGNLWIMDTRNKTGVPYKVRLLDIPVAILKKYEYLQEDGKLLPVISNQKMNEYLLEIANLCSINKKITCHVARHSFATLCLTEGMSIESVSKLLGHTKIKTTQIYARIIDRKLSDDMDQLAKRLKGPDSGSPSLAV